MMANYLWFMVGGVLISAISQILLKKSAEKNVDQKGFLKQYLNRYVIVGYLLLFGAMCVPLVAYTAVPLKYGVVIESLAYAFVMVLSAIFLKEKITKKKLIGNIVIVAGVIVFGTKIFV